MRRKQIAIVSLIFVLVVVALFAWYERTRLASSKAFDDVSGQVRSDLTNSLSGQVSSTNLPKPKSSRGISPEPPSKVDLAKEGLGSLNDKEIVFYGKVIDQSDAPVSDAAIAGSIQINDGARSGVDRVSGVSDAKGMFVISGHKGKALGVNVSKSGYVVATTNTWFVYSALWPEAERHVPNPASPVMFRMWKLQGAEPLVSINQHYKVHFTNGPAIFDLVTAKTVPHGGDVKITLIRPDGIISQQSPQDWSVLVEAVEGGLIKTSMAEMRVTYEAPSNGYEIMDKLAKSTTNHWSDLVQQAYFLRSRNDQVFGKVFISIDINTQPDDPVSITFRGIANANSSRNWEGTASR